MTNDLRTTFYPNSEIDKKIRAVVALRGGRRGDYNGLLLEAVRHYIMGTWECSVRTHAIRKERGLDNE